MKMDLKRISSLLENKPDLLVRQVVLDTAQQKKQIIYGARAINIQLPTYLKKPTRDYDILTKKPKKTAKEVALILNKRFGDDVFTVEKASHKGTYKIKYKGETVVDYTQLKKNPKTKKVFGVGYRDIKSVKRSTQRLAKKPGTEFRREKDLSTLKRIKELERIERVF